MSLFEIELNKDFLILNSIVFLEDKDFKKYYKLHSLNDGYDDDIEQYVDNHLLPIEVNSFVTKRGYLDEEKESLDAITHFMGQTLNASVSKNAQTVYLYPEWLLFWVAIKKIQGLFITEKDFETYSNGFQYIAEIRHKEYVIRNLNNFISHQEYKNVQKFQTHLHTSFIGFLNATKREQAYLFDFLNFLYRMHHAFKEKEKYKLMWNLETYIIEVLKLLLDQGLDLKVIYLHVAKGIRGTYAPMHEVFLHKPLYIEESKHYFRSFLPLIKTLFDKDLSTDGLIKCLRKDELFDDVLFSYIELTKRFNADKRNEIIMGAMIKGIVLGLEELIRDALGCSELDKFKFYDNCIKKLTPGSHQLKPYYEQIHSQMSNDDFFTQLESICNEEISLEKLLMVYYHTRNYLAHNNIDMERFFLGENASRKIITSVIDSVIVILYVLRRKEV